MEFTGQLTQNSPLVKYLLELMASSGEYLCKKMEDIIKALPWEVINFLGEIIHVIGFVFFILFFILFLILLIPSFVYVISGAIRIVLYILEKFSKLIIIFESFASYVNRFEFLQPGLNLVSKSGRAIIDFIVRIGRKFIKFVDEKFMVNLDKEFPKFRPIRTIALVYAILLFPFAWWAPNGVENFYKIPTIIPVVEEEMDSRKAMIESHTKAVDEIKKISEKKLSEIRNLSKDRLDDIAKISGEKLDKIKVVAEESLGKITLSSEVQDKTMNIVFREIIAAGTTAAANRLGGISRCGCPSCGCPPCDKPPPEKCPGTLICDEECLKQLWYKGISKPVLTAPLDDLDCDMNTEECLRKSATRLQEMTKGCQLKKNSLTCATIWNDLGLVRAVWSNDEKGTERLESAIHAFHRAEEIYKTHRASHALSIIRGNINVAEKILRMRRKGGKVQ